MGWLDAERMQVSRSTLIGTQTISAHPEYEFPVQWWSLLVLLGRYGCTFPEGTSICVSLIIYLFI